MPFINTKILGAWQNWVFVALVIMIVSISGYMFKQAKAPKEE